MANSINTTIAHELGHAIYGYLYEPEQYPCTMCLKDENSTIGYIEFEAWQDLAVTDGNIARIKGNSYLGGMFGELVWHDQVQVMGLRGDMDELLTELKYTGKEGNYRRSRGKLFTELWSWFYTSRDALSYGGLMKQWYDNGRAGKILTAAQIQKRLPETWKLYEKFLAHIDASEFREVVREINTRNKEVLYRRTLQMYGRRIIPDTVLHPEDI
jgi:hypothetical protein